MNWLVYLAILLVSGFCVNMDWLVYLVLRLVSCYFILVSLQGKKKNKQRSNVLPRYTKQRDKAEIEEESRKILKRELNLDNKDVPSYEWMRSKGLKGFLLNYLHLTKNDETLTTTAKANIVKTLSKNDLLRDLKIFFVYFCNIILN